MRQGIREAARAAVRCMIAVLETECAMEKTAVYIHMHEVVDVPNYVTGFTLPERNLTKPATGRTGVLPPAAAASAA
ncbi:hypothetical protein FOMPIDRAFT_1054221 [Fomitopsis schrenkii]|uniref:Uncharacterized protein n=1 Tax=Fomitopsis schrenkii TaxID=2126942 RepID=S8DQ15_FOMSC|nr:hypothetical protein FOMPIDRAFT_1054221 [Fomitopsis schrenkii]